MKQISKIAAAALPLVFIGSSVFSQSLDDAKKAIDAEQYQKAKSMLKNLTTTQADKDENYFYLGWVYILQDYPDSAKTVFNQGIAKNPKSALNYVGLGAVARIEKNQAAITDNFNKAKAAANKETDPYVYMGEAYLLDPADANAALAALNEGVALDKKQKNARLQLVMGNANRLLLKSNDALGNYTSALTIDPKMAGAIVAKGVLWKFANNFTASETEFKSALALDPNYGPAYREWAETDLRWALNDPKMASVKIKEGVENYKKYLSLTDKSVESRIRYADFLVAAGDYATLQTELAELEKLAPNNLKLLRYKSIAAFENKDYQTSLTAMQQFMSKAGEKRIISRDYYYLGKAQLELKDSTGIASLKKAATLDSTQVGVYADIAKYYFGNKQYLKAGDAYHYYSTNSKDAKLVDRFYEGYSYYYGYNKDLPNGDSVLTKADSAFSYVIQKMGTSPSADAYLYRARVVDMKEKDRNNIEGFAKPYYEKYIEIATPKAADPKVKKSLAEAYAYLGNYAAYKDKDDAKASEAFAKAKELDPTNSSVVNYYQRKGGAAKGK